ncbi:hypothetical protein ACTI_33360 [Actinoplanes sp. OR16]|uniref:SGNH/GDSL hydrolase family protein n=1 Tax=Actinoplanes sp. OR16 TaxID=946334 RepID=UPI000F6EA86D|nr:SGNH/GDSL hydrolase family protein [Actinoplanes sp. OR16]BBH66651.1 hypothetical protein ACTI_33360 [Actinoplanes sp. OR16]
MGDSYSAGNGTGIYQGAAGCWRSSKNYGEQYATMLKAAPYSQPTKVTTVACSGAVSADFANPKSGRPAQNDAITGAEDLIFLTVGGNDANFNNIVIQCLVAASRSGAKCNTLLTAAEKMIGSGANLDSELGKRVKKVLDSVYVKSKSRANPHIKIVMLGYAYLEGDTNYTLNYKSGTKTVPVAVGKRLKAISDKGEALQKAVVAKLNTTYSAYKPYTFVSVQKLFSGPPFHGLYAQKNNPNRWMVDPLRDRPFGSITTSYHPNLTGWTQEAKLLLANKALPHTKTQPVVVGGNLPTGTLGKPYTATLATTDNRAGTWTITGTLPAGLKQNGNKITGIPTKAGTSTLSVTFTDTLGTRTAAATKRLTVNPAATPAPGWQATTANGIPFISGLSCTTTLCTGYTLDSSNNNTPSLLSRASGGTWITTKPPLPAGVEDTNGVVYSTSCTETGTCAALGYYPRKDIPGTNAIIVWTTTGNGWKAQVIPTPSTTHLWVTNYTVSCGKDTCATITWANSTQDGPTHAILTTWTAATGWKSVYAPMPTSTAAPGTAFSNWDINPAVSCGTGVCAIASSYVDTTDTWHQIVWTYQASGWSHFLPPKPAGLDGGAYGRQPIGCGDGVCGMVTTYNPANGDATFTFQGWTWTGGRWSSPVNLPTTVDTSSSYIDAVTCSTFCVTTARLRIRDSGSDALAVWGWTSLTSWRALTLTAENMDRPIDYAGNTCGNRICAITGGHDYNGEKTWIWTSTDGVIWTPHAENNNHTLTGCGGSTCAAWTGTLKPVTGWTNGPTLLSFTDGIWKSQPAPMPADALTSPNSGTQPSYVVCGGTTCAVNGYYSTVNAPIDQASVAWITN